VDRDTILGLLAKVAPSQVVNGVVGVAPAIVGKMERELAVEFPRAYRAFLEAMGEETGGFALVAPTHSTRMSELLAAIGGPDDRPRRYWRISIERNLTQPMPVDFYLDLSTSNRLDAELVAFDYEPERSEDVGGPVGLTFYEQLRHRLFDQYLVVRPSFRVSLHAPERSSEAREQLRQATVHVLIAEGLEPFAPHAGRVDFFRRSDASVLLRQFDRTASIAVFIDTPTQEATVLLLEKIRDRFPDDAVVRWTRR
jgi:hypothetical protein